MKNITTLITVATFALSLILVGADDKKGKKDPNAERTIKGTLKCAKCALKVEGVKECQAALEIKRKSKDGKEITRVILLKNDDVTKAFHAKICKAAVYSAVTGKFEGKKKERVLVASKIAEAKEKKKK